MTASRIINAQTNVINPISSERMVQDNNERPFSFFSNQNLNIISDTNYKRNNEPLDPMNTIEIPDDEDDTAIMDTRQPIIQNPPSDALINQSSASALINQSSANNTLNQSTDIVIMNQLLSEKLPSLVNDMLPRLVDKRFEQEFRKQLELNKILQHDF